MKKTFESKLSQLRKKFNSKLIDLINIAYPNMVEKNEMLLKDSVSLSTANNESNLAGSVLRISHLVSSKPSALMSSLNYSMSVIDPKISQICIPEFRFMDVLISEEKLNMDTEELNLKLLNKVELLQAQLSYYKKLSQDREHIEKVYIRQIDTNIDSHRILRELASKTKKVSLLESRVKKLETTVRKFEIDSKKQLIQTKAETDELIEDELSKQRSTIDEYIKDYITTLLINCD